MTRPETICRAEVSSLSPGTLWYWRIAAKGKVLSPVGSFKTAADPDKTDEVSFIQVSDTQNAYYNEHKRNEAAYGADTLLEALRHFRMQTSCCTPVILLKPAVLRTNGSTFSSVQHRF